MVGQEIELLGKYGASFIGGETIDFRNNDSFYFDGFYCTYGVHGKGTCEIKDGYLYLYFEKTKTRKIVDTIRTPIITTSKCLVDTCHVKLEAVSNSDVPIPYGVVEILNAKGSKRLTTTDSLGFAEAYFKPNDFPLTIKISAVGIITNSIKLDSFSNYSIRLFHKLNSMIDKGLDNGEIYVYEIGDIYGEVIEMRPRGSSERFRKYRKMTD